MQVRRIRVDILMEKYVSSTKASDFVRLDRQKRVLPCRRSKRKLISTKCGLADVPSLPKQQWWEVGTI